MIKEKPKQTYILADELDEGLARAKKWKNLHFTKGGNSIYGNTTRQTEYECIAHMDKVFERRKETRGIVLSGGKFVSWNEYSHYIPMPVGE